MSEPETEAAPTSTGWPERLDEPAPHAEPTRGTASPSGTDMPTRAIPGIDAAESAGPSPRGAGSAPADGAAPAPRREGRIRHRLLPRTLLGITSVALAFAVGAAFSGTALYAYYQYQLNQTDRRVNTLVNGYKAQFERAEADLRSATAVGKAEIQAAADANRQAATNPTAQQALVRSLSPSLFVVTTETANGQPSVATAFVIASSANESLLLTSYTAVAAAATTPGPSVYVRPADGRGPSNKVAIRTWDPAHDLALIVLPIGNLPPLRAAPAHPGPQLGQTVFAVSALGSAGGAISPGEVDDVSSSGIADDIPTGPSFQGAPIINARGAVIGVASRTYAPLGFTPNGVWYAPFVQMACDRVLSCPGGSLGASS